MSEEDTQVVKNWPVKPTKCECGKVYEDKSYKVLWHEDKPVYLEIVCSSCDMNLIIDTDGSFREMVAF